MRSLVSIIIPCYNGEAFLDQLFDSILRQTWREIEVVVVNDGSTDNTEAKCLEWKPRFEDGGMKFIYVKQENGGQASALDAGLKLFTGDYLVWADSDDLLTLDSIEKKAAFLERNPDYAIVRHDANMVDEDNIGDVICRVSGGNPNRFSDRIFDDLILEETFCTPGCYMVRRSVVVECIPNLSIYCSRFGQNWQMLLPITLEHKVGYIDLPLYIYRIRKNSHSHAASTFSEKMRMLEGYKDIKMNVLGPLDIDHEDYNWRIDAFYCRRRFTICLMYRKYGQALAECNMLVGLGMRRRKLFALAFATCLPSAYRFLDGIRQRLGSRESLR